MADMILRNYDMDDDLMLQRAQVFHNAFVLDQATFVADFPALATPFEDDFQAAIDAADAIPPASEVESEIAYVTEQLNAQLPLGQKALQKLYTYCDEVWNSKAKTNEFGRLQYEKARNSQLKMRELLETANRVAQKASNKAALLAAGYTQAAIDELLTIRNAIDTLNSQQEDKLNARGYQTQLRIEALNLVWSFMAKINRSSKVTFVDNPAKLNEYMLYPNSGGSVPSKVQNLNFDVANTKLKWDIAAGAETYQLEEKMNAPGFDWSTIYEGPENEFVHLPPSPGTWLYRCRGINSNGYGYWSNELSVVQL